MSYLCRCENGFCRMEIAFHGDFCRLYQGFSTAPKLSHKVFPPVFHREWKTRISFAVQRYFFFFQFIPKMFPQSFQHLVENFLRQICGKCHIPCFGASSYDISRTDLRHLGLSNLSSRQIHAHFAGFGVDYLSYSSKNLTFQLFHISFPQGVGNSCGKARWKTL